MFAYCLDLALRSLGRNKVLTGLMVLTMGLGIGACITTSTLLRLLSGDPLPQKSARLFHPQLDPYPKGNKSGPDSGPSALLSYVDAMNLLRARKAERQALLALSDIKLVPQGDGRRPFYAKGVITTADFLPMFDAPFRYGGGWSAGDDERHAQVVVISEALNGRLFGGRNSVGRTLSLDGRDYRVAGVLGPWAPQPRFYALGLGGRSFGEGESVFLPLSSVGGEHWDVGSIDCYGQGNLDKLTTAPCAWLGFWVELGDAAAVASYRRFLDGYAHQQVAAGRFELDDTAMPDLLEWLRKQRAVPDDVRLQAGLAFGFLLICVVNTVGLLLAKCLRRGQEIGVRRALGASRRAIFAQFMAEAAVIGLAGGLLGLAFAELGLWGIRQQPAQYAGLAHLDIPMFLSTFAVSLAASLAAGLFPAWRASLLMPAPQLKAA